MHFLCERGAAACGEAVPRGSHAAGRHGLLSAQWRPHRGVQCGSVGDHGAIVSLLSRCGSVGSSLLELPGSAFFCL